MPHNKLFEKIFQEGDDLNNYYDLRPLPSVQKHVSAIRSEVSAYLSKQYDKAAGRPGPV